LAEEVLANGLRVSIVPVRGEKDGMVILAIRAGFFDEPAGIPHLAHVVEHAVVFGFKEDSEEARDADRWFREGRANGETLPGWMYFDLRVPRDELLKALNVQAARLVRPEFSNDLLQREIPRTLQEVGNLETARAFVTGKFAMSAFVQAAVHGKEEVPLKAATRAIRLEDLQRFHRGAFRPDRAALAILGDVKAEEVRPLIDRAFGASPKPKTPDARPTMNPARRILTARWDLRTRHLVLAWPSPPSGELDHAALCVAAVGLGRLLTLDPTFQGLAGTPIVTSEVPGLFLLNAQLRPDVEMEAVQDALVGPMDTLKGRGERGVALRTQARAGLASSLAPTRRPALFRLLNGPGLLVRANEELQLLGKRLNWGSLEGLSTRIETLSDERLRETIARCLDPGKAVVVRIVPAE
ncbi:MAG: M16 family metallopeptidase, partial [Isosphaeraceae bacterium]